jgi:hypothetical protein
MTSRTGVRAASSAFGWNAWPINTIMSAEGLPLQPWKEPVANGGVWACKRAAVQGCYNDTEWTTTPYRIIPYYQPQLHDKVTYERCASACFGLQQASSNAVGVGPPPLGVAGVTPATKGGDGRYAAGIDGGNHCFCGKLLAGAAVWIRPATECQTVPCHADPSETQCGGVGRMVVYNYTCTPALHPPRQG